MATSDGHRLTVARCDLMEEPSGDGELNALPPAQIMGEVSRIMGGTDDNILVTIETAGQWMSFETSEAILKAHQIRGTYPNYEQLIPDKWTTKATLEIADLKRATQAASIFANDGSNIIRLELESARDGESGPARMTVSGRSDAIGHNRGVVDLAELEGENNKVAINVKYLKDVINASGRDRLTLEMTNASSPVVFTSEGVKEWKHIAMPMHVQW